MAGENKQINELSTRTFDGNSLVPFDLPNTDPSTQAQKPYVTGKCNGYDVADFIANTEEYTTDLDTTAKTITGAINELNTGKADFADISNTVSFGSDINASSSFKWVVKIGKLVYIYANLQPKENWSSGNKILLADLPPRNDYQESNYIPYIVGAQYFNSLTNDIRGSAVNGSNQLQTQNAANISTTNRIYINGFYRCQ